MIDFKHAPASHVANREAASIKPNAKKPRVGTNTVGSLPGSAYTLAPDDPVKKALDALNADSELSGIIVAKPGYPIRVLSRSNLFENLGRPFGVAIFMNRPVAELLEQQGSSPLIVDHTAGIGETVRAAMNRELSSRYEPIIVRLHQESYRLVDLQALLLAQSRLLVNSAAMVARQSELALALSGTLDLDALLALILEGICELVPYERAVVYMADGDGLVKAAERIQSGTLHPDTALEPESRGSMLKRVLSDDDGWATFPLVRGEQSLGYLCVKRKRDREQEGWREIVTAFAASAALAVANARMYSKLEELAAVDQLTGVLNRRSFIDKAQKAAALVEHQNQPSAAIMLDLDRFKRINDTHGHAAGDAVLKATAIRIAAELRTGDIVGRYGGEEFVFLLTDTDEAAAGVVAERIRERIAATPVPWKETSIPVTASVGIAATGKGHKENLASLIDRADTAMYAAKRAGRNRTRYAVVMNPDNAGSTCTQLQPTSPPRRRKTEKSNPRSYEVESTDTYLHSISSVLEALSFGAPFHELAAITLDGIRDADPASGAAILIKSAENDALKIIAQQGLSDSMIGETIGVGFSYAGRAALERRIVTASKATILDTAPELAFHMEQKGYSRYRAFPLSARGKSLGVLEIFDSGDNTTRSRGLAAIASTLGAAAAFASMIDEATTSTRNLSSAYDATLEAWVHMLELRDQETEGHSRRVTDMTVELANSLSVPPELVDDYRRGALLHDIGKMGVPDSILLKPGQLTAEERETMSQHPTHAFNVIKAIPFLADSIDIPYCHHERWDGTGYPRGLAGRSIPLAARLFAVVDVWDALRSDRPYRKALGAEESAAIIAAGAGSQFDPDIVANFLDLRRDEILG